MAKITLRAYQHDIEGLIEKGQIEEAIGHCKYILKQYPKYIDVYRLLGKAYLEGQRYTEASDILQRVLSVIPDDFISQIGMSIIREDEGNLDASIWHMERAFEVQPSNAAVQEELKRLYGRRDGVQPPKIRLTRGAMVRMYARGELYTQAIAEIFGALKEDPQRYDLQIILAKMYYLSGQKTKAVQTCNEILTKLPFCLEANKILAELLPDTDRPDDAKLIQKRMAGLDPYYGFINPKNQTLSDVPDTAVMIERIEWQPSQAADSQPDWAKTIGVAWETKEDATPDWLKQVSEPAQPKVANVTDNNPPMSNQEPDNPLSVLPQPEMPPMGTNETLPPVPPTSPEEPIEKPEIPDWMSSVGWSPSTSSEEEPASLTLSPDNLTPQSENDILPAEIPDWLKAIAPAEDQSPKKDAEDLSGLENLFAQNPPAASDTQPTAVSTAQAEIPTPLETNLPAEPVSTAQPADDFPDWLNSLAKEQSTGSLTLPDGDLPDWLRGSKKEEAPNPTPSSQSMPPAPIPSIDWTAPQQPAIPLPEASTQPGSTDTVPDWLLDANLTPPVTPISDTQPHKVQAPAEVPTPAIPPEPVIAETSSTPVESAQPAGDSSQNIDSGLAWLESLAAKHGADEATLSTKMGERLEIPPEWLQQQSISQEPVQPVAAQTAETPVESQTSTPAPEKAELPDWLAGVLAQEFPEESSPEIPTPAASSDWQPIEPELATENSSESVLEAEIPSATPAEELPGWLANMSEETPIEQPVVSSVSSTEVEMPLESVETPATQGGQDIESALAWLESLAAKQGADEQTLDIKPEDRLEEPPQWVQQTAPVSSRDEIEEIISAEPENKDFTGALPYDATISENDIESASAVEGLPSNETTQQAPIVPETQETIVNPTELSSTEDTVVSQRVAQVETSADVPQEPVVSSTDETIQINRQSINAVPAAESIAPSQSSTTEPDSVTVARKAYESGKPEKAAEHYGDLIQKGENLEEIIHDLRDALYRYPVDIGLWQALGDAYVRSNHLQEALEAYSKAESLLR